MMLKQIPTVALIAGVTLAGLSAGGRTAQAEVPATQAGPDFDGDGFGDQAIGAPSESVAGALYSGVVHVLYGTASGLSATDNQLWSQASAGVADEPQANDEFGSAIAWGDFDGDGFDDLAVGARGESWRVGSSAGIVTVLYGSATGVTGSGSQLWSQSVAGVADDPEGYDQFGGALLARDFNGDGNADLVISATGEDDQAGVVHVLLGSGAGLTASGSQLWHQPSGTPGPYELFGWSLAAGDLNGDGHQDLAVSAPTEDDGLVPSAGAVNVLYGSATGLTATGNQLWNHRSSGLPAEDPEYDFFGGAIAIGRFDGDAIEDLAIGAPREEVNTTEAAGAVRILFGSADGLTRVAAEKWTQDSPGVLNEGSRWDEFGTSLSAADFDGDAVDDLAIGVPSECRIDPCADDAGEGAVNVLRGSAGGLTDIGDQFWSQDSAGIAETGEDGDRFGADLARGDVNGDGRTDLVVGNGDETMGRETQAGDVHVLYAAPGGLATAGSQLWSQNSAGILDTAERYDYFGGALLSS